MRSDGTGDPGPFGGELVLGEVFRGRAKVGYHYWNRLPDGTEVDLTADQFHPGETVVGSQVQRRPPAAPRRCRAQYELLRQRVLAALTPAGAVSDHALEHHRCPAGASAADALIAPAVSAGFGRSAHIAAGDGLNIVRPDGRVLAAVCMPNHWAYAGGVSSGADLRFSADHL